MNVTEEQRTVLPIGRLVLGLVLLLIGVGWLLDAADLVEVPWAGFLPAVLIVIGLGVLIAARQRVHGGLVSLGFILTFVLLVATSVDEVFDVDMFGGGIGEQTERPAVATELQSGYTLSMGQLVVDLREVDFPPGTTEVQASVGIGQLQVFLPADVILVIDANVAAGEIAALGEKSEGVSAEMQRTFEATGAESTVELRATVGLGQIEVQR